MDDPKGRRNGFSWADHSLRSEPDRATCGFVKTALPFILSSFACALGQVALPDIWPILGIGYQAGTHRIHANVVCLFLRRLGRTQAMIKKVALPVDAMALRKPAFPR